VELEGQADLPEIVGTGGTVGRIPRRLDGGKEEPDERADDRDHDQELDERKSVSNPNRLAPKRFISRDHGEAPG
jgi:hypothetical protein